MKIQLFHSQIRIASLLTLIIVLNICKVQAQNSDRYSKVKDSLQAIILVQKDTDKIQPLIELFQHVYPGDFDLADSIYTELKLIKQNNTNSKDIVAISFVEASIYNYENKYDSLQIISKQALNNDYITKQQRSRAYNNLGICEERTGTLDSALYYYQLSEKHSEPNNYKLFNNIGRVHTRMSNIGEAIKYYQLAMSIAKDKGLTNAEAVIANNIGAAYENIENLNKASEYYKLSLKLKRQLNDEKGMLYALYNLSIISDDINSDQDYMAQGLALAEKINNTTFIELFKIRLGNHLIEKGKLTEAEDLLLPLYNQIKSNPSEYNMSIEIALSDLYIAKRQYDKAKIYLDAFSAYANNINATSELHNVKYQYLQIHDAQKDYKKYYEVAREYYPYEDSIKTDRALNKFIKLEEQLDIEQKEKVQLLNNALVHEENNKYIIGLISLLLATILTLLLHFRNKRIKYQNQVIETEKENVKLSEELNKQLQLLDTQKTNFYTNITHDLRTPLTLILGPLEQLKSKTSDPENLELIKMMQKNARRQLVLVNQLLDLSKLDAGKSTLHFSKVDVVLLLQNVTASYKPLLDKRNIGLDINASHSTILLYLDTIMMDKIIFNIISNSIKHTPDNGDIIISILKKENTVDINIKDTGVGIPADKIEKIFDRYFQIDNAVNNKLQSTGVGLSLTKELVEIQGGSISVDSKIGAGTVVSLSFLIGRDHISDSEIIAYDNSENQEHSEAYINLLDLDYSEQNDTNQIIKGKSDQPKILIVEDNVDVTIFLKQILESDYEVLTAANGQEGNVIAIENNPDLIISDVMMPILGGYELCKSLKQNINTSHIPIILLTAKATHDEKIEGLETGADAYIFKPFDPREISIRAQNLIQSRKILRSKFATEINVKPSEVTTNSIDQNFLSSALINVEDNISNESFKVDDLAKLMNMSKPNLNRKLRALVDKSTNKFIQSIRLQRARNLLENKSGSVTEIAYQVGFSSPSYFVKCYKDEFNETPGSIQ